MMNHSLENVYLLMAKGVRTIGLEKTLLSQITVINDLPFCQLTWLQ